jgi:hypothetical protein
VTAASIRANVRAILAARRGRGFRSRWIIAGRGHAVTYSGPGRYLLPGAWVHFPSRAKSGDARQGLALNMHRDRAKGELARFCTEPAA